MSLIKIITEKAPSQITAMAEIIVSHLTSGLPISEMRAKRGADFSSTKFYQIRVKPSKPGEKNIDEVLKEVFGYLKSPKSKKLGINEIQINEKSRNSSKYSSVSFKIGDVDYDIVVAMGGNKGESFEKDMLIKMDNLVAGIDTSAEAREAFLALEKIDSSFKISNIAAVSARSGSTQRSGDMSPEETGKIIADITVKLKNNQERYISLKNKSGSTIAQFGISKAFTDDLKVNTKSDEWKNWISPFNLDVSKIESGLQAAATGEDLEWEDIVSVDISVLPTSKIFKLLEKLWGSEYYYLREKTTGFFAMKVDSDTLKNKILHKLKVTEIRYPSKDRKQINIYLESDSTKLKVEMRNPRGKGSVKPTQIQLTLMKIEFQD